MNTRCWLGLMLIVLAGISFGASDLHAQLAAIMKKRRTGDDSKAERPSHYPLNTGFADNLKPEELLANRLLQSRLRNPGTLDEAQMKSLKDIAKQLFDDPQFRKSIQEQSSNQGRFSKESIERFRDQLRDGESKIDLGWLKDLLKDVKGSGDSLSLDRPELIKKLSEMQERLNSGSADPQTPPSKVSQPENPAAPSAAKPSDSGVTPSRDATPDKASENSSEMLRKLAEKVVDPKWVDSVMGQNWQKTLAEMAAKASQARGQASRLSNRAGGLSRYMPRLRSLVPNGFFGRTPQPRFPSLPRFGAMRSAPSLPEMSGQSAAGIGKFILAVGFLATLGFIFWRAGKWWEKARLVHAQVWRLGPWPVNPGEISTRADLVRAFEYLSLLRLGLAARTCHHLELAQRMSEQPALDRERRREAATTLAHLYEQARYCPDDETLSPESIARARRELCYLAGAPA